MNTFNIQSHDLFISEKGDLKHRKTEENTSEVKQNGKNRDTTWEKKKRYYLYKCVCELYVERRMKDREMRKHN